MSSRTNTKQKSSRVPSAAEKVADIEELLSQILLALPHRPLYRFKCVCKHWFSLITGFYHPKVSCFISKKICQEHFKFIPLIPQLEKTSPTWNPFKSVNEDHFIKSVPQSLRLLRKSLGRSLEIIQSCNGLFLCGDGYRSSNVYVVNPTTNQFLRLSSPSAEWYGEYLGPFVRYGLAFEPSKCPHYKVVCVSHHSWSETKKHCIDIYSSETREWKRLKIRPSPSPFDKHMQPMNFGYSYMRSESPVFCNGAIHWIRRQRERGLLISFHRGFKRQDWDMLHSFDRGFKREDWDMLHFDVDKELFKLATATPPVPQAVKNIPLNDGRGPTMLPYLDHSYFGESGGRLYLIEVFTHSRAQFEVMEMERDYSAWIVKYSVDLNSVFTAFPQLNSSSVAVLNLFQEKEIRDNEEEGSLCLLLHMPGKVISYNLMKKTFNISIELTNKYLFLGLYTYPYMESLLAPV